MSLGPSPARSYAEGALVDAAVDHYDLLARCRGGNAAVAEGGARVAAECRAATAAAARLRQHCRATAGRTSAEWRRAQSALGDASRENARLLALLEAPALVAQCAQAEMYHEALALVRHLQPPPTPAGAALAPLHARAARALQEQIGASVLPALSRDLSVDSAYRVVSFLRSAGVPSQRLSQLLLECRGTHVDRLLLAATAAAQPYARLLRLLDVLRTQFAEVALQHRACFPDADAERAAELADWAAHRAALLLRHFAGALAQVTSCSELALVLDQCELAGRGGAELGLGLGPVLADMIAARVTEIFRQHLGAAHGAYAAAMQTLSYRDLAACASAAEAPGDAAELPTALTPMLPLAYALNGALAALNAVRRCALAGTEAACAAAVGGLLAAMLSDLLRDAALLPTMDERQRRGFVALARAFSGLLLPHLRHCVRAVFGEDVGADPRVVELSARLAALLPREEAPAAAAAAAAAPPPITAPSPPDTDTAASPPPAAVPAAAPQQQQQQQQFADPQLVPASVPQHRPPPPAAAPNPFSSMGTAQGDEFL